MFNRCLDLLEEKGVGILSWETGDFRSTDHLVHLTPFLEHRNFNVRKESSRQTMTNLVTRYEHSLQKSNSRLWNLGF